MASALVHRLQGPETLQLHRRRLVEGLVDLARLLIEPFSMVRSGFNVKSHVPHVDLQRTAEWVPRCR